MKLKSPTEACPDTSRSPAAQRVSGLSFEPSSLTGPTKTGPNSPRVKAAGGLDAVIAGQHGLEALHGQRTVLGGEREIDRADQIAAKSGLLDGKGQRAVAELGRLAEHLVGEHVEHRGRRRPLLGARHREQRIEIDKARRKLGLGRHALAEIERELALEDLRMAVGVKGEIEIGQLGAIGRGFDRPLQFVKRRSCRAGRPRPAARAFSASAPLPPRWRHVTVAARTIDGAVELGLGAEPGHAAVERVGGVAVEIAQRRLDAEQSGRRRARWWRSAAPADAPRSRSWPRPCKVPTATARSPRRRSSSSVNCGTPCLVISILPPADADLVEHHVFRGERQRHAAASHIAPIAGAVGLEIEPQDRIDDGDLARLDGTAEQRADIEPGLERAGFEERPVEASLLIGDLDVVESELGRGQTGRDEPCRRP